MDPLTAIAASGLRARMESLELLANNVANASTGGYKADREFYSLYLAPEAEESDSPQTMPLIERPWTDISQGVIRVTGNPLDVAISGQGFFAVQGRGRPLYTRNGGFSVGADGTLLAAEGLPVRAVGGTGLKVQGTRPIEITPDGTVRQDGTVVGQLEIVDFTSTAALTKQGSNYFRLADPSATPVKAAGISVEQGRIEDSNTGTAETAVRLVGIMRQFEMLQKAVSLAADMNRQAVEQVAKVGS